MDTLQAIKERHSVRSYLDKKIDEETRASLNSLVEDINKESGLHIQIRYDEPEGFDSKMAHYGNFKNVNNYIIIAADKKGDYDEKAGYYGEKLVLEAQKLGLRTCWVAMTFNKGMVKKLLRPDEQLIIVISLGYGENDGVAHKGKTSADVAIVDKDAPEWFVNGVEAALLAPTAVNQQKFKITLKDEKPEVKVAGLGIGPCLKIDLGIIKYHFEVGSGVKL